MKSRHLENIISKWRLIFFSEIGLLSVTIKIDIKTMGKNRDP